MYADIAEISLGVSCFLRPVDGAAAFLPTDGGSRVA
jgi:hypothetical protein